MDIGRYLSWRKTDLKGGDGILVGGDISQEWLLPWWWEHYCKHASHPVAFADFGLSFPMKDWCRERGELIPIRILDDFIAEKETIAPHFISLFEENCGKKFWNSRKTWFKKPFACLQTPFQRTIWIDLDCEIRGSFQELFDFADSDAGISMTRDRFAIPLTQMGIRQSHHHNYNSGVVIFRRELEIIREWAKKSIEDNHLFLGDQDVLSHLLAERKICIPEFPPRFNWSRLETSKGIPIIMHWSGMHGKELIRSQIHLKNIRDSYKM